MIVEADPVGDDARGVLDALEAMAVNAWLLEGADDALDHAVLLWDEPWSRHWSEAHGECGVMNSCFNP